MVPTSTDKVGKKALEDLPVSFLLTAPIGEDYKGLRKQIQSHALNGRLLESKG